MRVLDLYKDKNDTNMDKILETLKEDYILRAGLKRKKLKVHDELDAEINSLEQTLISSKIIPELQQYAQSLLKDLECEVYLSVMKDMEGNIEITDENGNTISMQSQTSSNLQPSSQNNAVPESNAILITSSNIYEVQGHDIRITIDGKIFHEKNAIQTFIKALEYIGLDKVASVGIICSGYNLVDTRQRTDGYMKWQQQIGDKWVYINYSNITKMKYLMQIADFLKLDIKIEAI